MNDVLPGSVGLVRPQTFHSAAPLPLKSGAVLPEFTLVYETYGMLNADASNAAYFQLNTLYPFGSHESNLLKYSGVYQFPITLLDTSAKISNQIQLEALPSYEAKIREFRVHGKGNILVYSNGGAAFFLPINTLSHSVKIKEDVPFNERTSSFALIR